MKWEPIFKNLNYLMLPFSRRFHRRNAESAPLKLSIELSVLRSMKASKKSISHEELYQISMVRLRRFWIEQRSMPYLLLKEGGRQQKFHRSNASFIMEHFGDVVRISRQNNTASCVFMVKSNRCGETSSAWILIKSSKTKNRCQHLRKSVSIPRNRFARWIAFKCHACKNSGIVLPQSFTFTPFTK